MKFEKGDKVECVMNCEKGEKEFNQVEIGGIYTISCESSEGKGWLGFEELKERETGWPKEWFKIIKEEKDEVREFKGCKIPQGPNVARAISRNTCNGNGPTGLEGLGCEDMECSECILFNANTEILKEYKNSKPTTTKEETHDHISDALAYGVGVMHVNIKGFFKEEAMNINETIRKVFKGESFELVEAMQENFGNEIAATFTGEIGLIRDKKKYIAEIERLEEEARKEAEA